MHPCCTEKLIFPPDLMIPPKNDSTTLIIPKLISTEYDHGSPILGITTGHCLFVAEGVDLMKNLEPSSNAKGKSRPPSENF